MGEDDPERQREDELLRKLREHDVTDAELEEIRLYAEGDSSFVARMVEADRARVLGHGWLARVEADHRLEQLEDRRFVRIERGCALALMGTGAIASAFVPIVAAAMLGLGALMLLVSIVRIRLQTHARDPYRDVKR